MSKKDERGGKFTAGAAIAVGIAAFVAITAVALLRHFGVL